ncbi:MAG: DUF1559 domain-containing protein [Armatimonadota bacterium]
MAKRVYIMQVLIPLLALALLSVAVTVPWYTWPREKARTASCLSNMKSLALATLTYAQDHDERLPPAPKVALKRNLDEGRLKDGPIDLAQYFAADDWHRQIHYRNPQVFMCPSTRSICSYEFNAKVYGARLPELKGVGSTVLEYEAGFLTGSPRGPHLKGYNTTYCDGHAKWLPGSDGR